MSTAMDGTRAEDTGLRTTDGGRVDRTRRIGFTFDGQSYAGLMGDTLASALLANGVHLTGRSFKYHRPRGIFGAGSEEPNALVTVSRASSRSTVTRALGSSDPAARMPRGR